MTLQDLAARIGATLEGDGSLAVTRVAPLDTAAAGDVSFLANASYATSEVVITSTMLKSWDRGFDSADHQVWGASGGPYEFVKNLPAAEIMTAESGLEESTDSETTDLDGG